MTKRSFGGRGQGPTMLPRHEIWRRAYRAKPYAQHLERIELNKRIRDIFLNMLTVTKDAKIGILQVDKVGLDWMNKWTDVLEEMVFRYGPYPNGFERDVLHSQPFPDFASDLAAKASAAISALGLRRGQGFIKLGREDHMRSLLEEGGLRIQPASYYSQTGHNQAVQDDEMTLPLSFSLRREDVVRLVTNPADVPPQIAHQRLDIEFRSPSDFYLYCVTKSVDPRLFVDFSCNACVVIRDRLEFGKRLKSAMRKVAVDFEEREGNAIYIDPLLPQTAKVFVPLSKPFGYSYQDEYRFAWLPRKPGAKLCHLDLKVGSLADIAELVVL